MTTRRSGRTLAMVRALPEKGGTVVVHCAAMRDYVRRMIYDVRGPVLSNWVKIVVITDTRSLDMLRVADAPVAVDHAWWEVNVGKAIHDEMTAVLERIRVKEERGP